MGCLHLNDQVEKQNRLGSVMELFQICKKSAETWPARCPTGSNRCWSWAAG